MEKQPQALDVTPLFRLVGLTDNVVVAVNEHTYEVDLEHPSDNWLYPAFRAFQELNYRLTAEHKTPHTFTTLGTGPGIDAIGAVQILRPEEIIITDIHPEVLMLAQQNIEKNVDIKCRALLGNICAPLREQNIVSDVIYANLPNVPFAGHKKEFFDDQITSSFFDGKTISGIPIEFSRYLLAMQYATLLDARDCLRDGGSLLLNIGGRVPFHLIEQMCTDAGYMCEELCVMFKAQSQPEVIVKSYAEAERFGKVEFDFYRFDEANKIAEQFSHRTSTNALKKVLSPYRVSASQAWDLYTEENLRIGHIVHVIRAVKI
ncbi:MAG: hypothetical protein KIH62_002050 [Candidatus Kerfeldbacteria bacterium]|nr:hypothetical protein [Candidatus Kerfeldbacteria bacterium]